MEQYGTGWIDEAIKHIQEDKYQHYQIMTMLVPLARTPQDKKGANAMQKYSKQVEKVLGSLVPWIFKPGKASASYRGKVKPGETVVMLSSGETADLPLFKNAKVVKQK